MKPEPTICARCGSNFFAGEVCLGCCLRLGLADTIRSNQSEEAAFKGEEQLGSFYLLRQIGSGGHGTVYLAEERVPVQRTVAVKVLKTALNQAANRARFEVERQTLARLEHPNIARLLAAGTTPEGRPWFAMEYVSGETIKDYCDRRRLTLKQRVELFLEVCAAIQYAHERGVIHRDLKPQNILVSEKGAVRIIDFGIATFQLPLHSRPDIATQAIELAGTPAYMSPEQVAGAGAEARSDLYALGVVLYELLAGVRPFDDLNQRNKSLVQATREISVSDAPKFNQRWQSLDDAQFQEIAEARRCGVTALLTALSGDLESIVLHGLERQPAERYESVAALAEDLERYLADGRLSVRSWGGIERIARQARRHRKALQVTTVLLAALLVAGVSIKILLVRQARAKLWAEQSAQRNRESAKFLEGVFTVMGPEVIRSGNLELMRQMAATANAGIANGWHGEPKIAATVYCMLAELDHELGDHEGMREAAYAALRECLKEKENKALPVARAFQDLSEAEFNLGKLDQAERDAQRAVLLRQDLPNAGQVALSSALNNLGLVLLAEKKWDEAARIVNWAMRLDVADFGAEHRRVAADLTACGTVAFEQGKLELAEYYFQRSYDLQKKIPGIPRDEQLKALYNVAMVLRKEGKVAEALACLDNATASGLFQREPSSPNQPHK